MNRPSFRRKPMITLTALLAMVFLAGCATHYPYSGRDGVYYGKHHGAYGHGYKRPYGYSGYSYNYYRYNYVNRYGPWWSGYGHHHSRPIHRSHDRGHDHHRDRDAAHRSGDASRELRRVTDQDRRRALLRRNEPAREATVRNEAPRHQDTRPSSNRPSTHTNSAREQLRRSTPSRGDSGGRSSPSTRDGTRTRPEGGIRTPKKRQR